MRKMLLAGMLTLLVSGCGLFEIKQYDPDTVKYLEDTIVHDQELVTRLQAMVDSDTPPAKKDLKGLVLRVESHELRTEARLNVEKAKEKVDEPTPEPTPEEEVVTDE